MTTTWGPREDRLHPRNRRTGEFAERGGGWLAQLDERMSTWVGDEDMARAKREARGASADHLARLQSVLSRSASESYLDHEGRQRRINGKRESLASLRRTLADVEAGIEELGTPDTPEGDRRGLGLTEHRRGLLVSISRAEQTVRAAELEEPTERQRYADRSPEEWVPLIDQHGPLVYYGDLLHFDGTEHSANIAEALESIVPEHHWVVARHMAGRRSTSPSSGIWVGATSVPNLDNLSRLRQEKPTGDWVNTPNASFDDLDGVVSGGTVMAVGLTENSYRGLGRDTALHEFGHALDHALGTVSAKPEWIALHSSMMRGSTYGMSPHFQRSGTGGQAETWGESYHLWSRYRYDRAKFLTEFNAAFGGRPKGSPIAGRVWDYMVAMDAGIQADYTGGAQ